MWSVSYAQLVLGESKYLNLDSRLSLEQLEKISDYVQSGEKIETDCEWCTGVGSTL